jgi:hypothetical protein
VEVVGVRVGFDAVSQQQLALGLVGVASVSRHPSSSLSLV